MQKTPKIRLRDVSKTYHLTGQEVVALSDLSEDVHEGDFVSVVGASGCGKSTLLWCVAGLQQPTRGSIYIDDNEVRKPIPTKIGMVFQESNMLPWRTLLENIYLPFEIKRNPIAHSKIEELLEITGLNGFEKAMPGELSGGMRQRASIVRALAQDPEVLLMDEPFSALDAFTRDEMNLLLMRLWDTTKKTILFVTHSINEAIFLSTKVWAMTPRPGKLSKSLTIPFGRERSKEIEFSESFNKIAKELKHEVQQPRIKTSRTGTGR